MHDTHILNGILPVRVTATRTVFTPARGFVRESFCGGALGWIESSYLKAVQP